MNQVIVSDDYLINGQIKMIKPQWHKPFFCHPLEHMLKTSIISFNFFPINLSSNYSVIRYRRLHGNIHQEERPPCARRVFYVILPQPACWEQLNKGSSFMFSERGIIDKPLLVFLQRAVYPVWFWLWHLLLPRLQWMVKESVKLINESINECD